MQRREFIRETSMFAIGVGAFGSVRLNNGHFEGDTPTTTDILGPFYRPNAPFRTNLNPPGYKGRQLRLSGTVFRTGGKTPFGDALVEIWQCDSNEVYDNTSDDFAYRASQRTAADGKYHFITSRPVPYAVTPGALDYRPAHIHMRISGEGEQDLVTQVYFKNDPHLDNDPYSSARQAINRILPISVNDGGDESVGFDIVLSKEYVPDATVFKRLSGIYRMNNGTLDEFYKNGDSLYLKRNGQILSAYIYAGNNEFKNAIGSRVRFELLSNGEVKACFLDSGGECSREGLKVFKY